MKASLFAAVSLLALAGCSSAPVPTEQLNVTDQAIAQAQAVIGGEDAQPLQGARQKAGQARAALANGDNKAARLAAEQAELDARWVEAQALATKSDVRRQQLQNQVGRLHRQLEVAQ